MMNFSSIFDFDISVYGLQYYEENGKNVVAFFSILMVLGIVGNGHVLLVYRRAQIEFNFQVFIMALEINNFLACSIVIPNEIAYIRYNFTYRNVVACKIFNFLSCTLVLISVFLFMLTGFERYRRICTPIKEQLRRKAVLVSIAIVSVVSCFLSIPVLQLFSIVGSELTEYPFLNGTKCGFVSSTFTYIYFGLILLIGTIIFIFLVAAYLMIAKVLYRQRQRQYALKTSSNKTKLNPKFDSMRFQSNSTAIRNTISLMFVTVFSYMGSIPLFIIVLVKFADENAYQKFIHYIGKSGSTILMKGYFINNVVNPIVYIIVNKQFRERIKNIYMAVARFLREVLISKSE